MASRSPAPSLPITLGNMRANGVRSLSVTCWLCHHDAVLAVDRWSDDVPVPAFGPAHGLYQLRDGRGQRAAEFARAAGAAGAAEPIGSEMVMATVQEWLALGDRLYAKGVDVFNGSEVMDSTAGTRDPKVVALTLLARTLGHFQAAVLLLESKHVVESRTLTRCCWENLFWIAALAKKRRRVREVNGAR